MQISIRLPLLLAVSLSSTVAMQAQAPRLWGMTPMGGANNKGTLFHIDADGTDFTVVHHFDEASGWGPEGTLCLASNGKLYGTTNLGGTGSIAAGTLFSFNPSNGLFTKLVDFDLTNGGYGWSGMIAATDGMLYGATYGGGSGGSIFRLDPNSDTYTILYSLNQTVDGGAIEDRLLQRADGTLFGVASQGGANNAGTLFRFDLLTNTFTKLHDFDGGANGKTPYGTLCDAGDGWLYGTTWEGGSGNKGTLYRYNPTTLAFAKLIDFTGPNGQSPWNGPLREGSDLLLGTVTLGGSANSGLIYRYVPSTAAFTEAFAFNLLDGGTLFGNLFPASDGQYYGLANFGGTSFEGIIYRYNPLTNSVTNLHSFTSATDGYSPRGDLIQAGLATGITEAEAIAFTMHPNPSNGPVRIMVDLNSSAETRLHVLNGIGQVIHAERLVTSTTDIQLQAPGMYLVQLANGDRIVSRKLVIE